MFDETRVVPEPKLIWPYLAWTFGWSWGSGLVVVFLNTLLPGRLPFMLYGISILATFGPALGVKKVLRLFFREFLAFIFSRPSKKAWIPLVLLIAMLVLTTLLASKSWNSNSPFWLMPIFFVFTLICGGGNEEIGWRGFLQPALEKRFSFWQATVLTGLVWALWHAPLWLVSESHASTPFLIYTAGMILTSFAYAGLYKSTQSVWCCAMLHAAENTIGLYLVPEGYNQIIYLVGIGLMAIYGSWLWYQNNSKDKKA